MNSFRHSRAITVLKTKSETRILGNFADITNNEIGQQMAEIFELKEKSLILTCILGGFSVHFENFGRLYLLKYWSHRLVEHIGRKLRLQRMCLCIQKVTSKGNPKFQNPVPRFLKILGSLLRAPSECRNTFSELSPFEWYAPQVSVANRSGDKGVQTLKNGVLTPLWFTC